MFAVNRVNLIAAGSETRFPCRKQHVTTPHRRGDPRDRGLSRPPAHAAAAPETDGSRPGPQGPAQGTQVGDLRVKLVPPSPPPGLCQFLPRMGEGTGSVTGVPVSPPEVGETREGRRGAPRRLSGGCGSFRHPRAAAAVAVAVTTRRVLFLIAVGGERAGGGPARSRAAPSPRPGLCPGSPLLPARPGTPRPPAPGDGCEGKHPAPRPLGAGGDPQELAILSAEVGAARALPPPKRKRPSLFIPTPASKPRGALPKCPWVPSAQEESEAERDE